MSKIIILIQHYANKASLHNEWACIIGSADV